jgi:2-keto-4-pentenoate hydratase/2-oxohepta-3-ene-1,7-dioic acid hydratase in catechol pathway
MSSMTNRRAFLVRAVAAAGAIVAGGAAKSAEADTAHEHRDVYLAPRGRVLVSIWNPDGSESLGVKRASDAQGKPLSDPLDGAVLDVRRAAMQFGVRAPTTLDQLLRDGAGAALDHLEQLVAADGSARAAALSAPESSIKRGRLFAAPGKIVCVGVNFRRHAEELGVPIPKVPVLFAKYPNALAPPDYPLRLPGRDVAYKFDYGTALVVAIGRPARDVAERDALDYVAGYCCGNDFSARDLQLESGGQWLIGKTLDGFAPIGPYFVGADLVGDPNHLRIETRVNGEVRQSSNTRDFIFNVQQLIAYLSRYWTLDPGDLIFTGTPPGVIAGYPKERQVWLKAGDRIESSIEKLGTLRFELV